jgi:NADPH-dependent 7-cyano-7-deazaguanine reductase QueF
MERLHECPEGYFEFTKKVAAPHLLRGWEDWFRKKGIKTVIIRDKNHTYCLCREGEEAGR